jgi:ribokinase
MTNIEIVGLGALNMDNIYRVERILEDGETVVRDLASFPGGSAANTIYGLARLGLSTGFIGAVGDDAEGKALIQDLQKAGVDTTQIKVKSEAKTGSTLCLSDELGRRSIYVLPGANNRLTIDDPDMDYINKAKWLHISSFVADTQFQVLTELMGRLDASVKVSFSPGALYAARGLQALGPILARTHVLLVNQQEIKQLTGEDLSSGAETCLKQGCQIVIVTLGKGASGETGTAVSYIKTTDKEYMVESGQNDKIRTSDTTGAGDAFAAGFLYGLLNSKGLEECGRLGGIVARFSIAKTGARQGLPALDELVRRYRQLYNKQL